MAKVGRFPRRRETPKQRLRREARELEGIPEEMLTKQERDTLRAAAEEENYAFDRATDR